MTYDADISLCAYDRVERESGNVLCREMIGFPKTIALPPEDDILAFINSSLWNKLIRTDLMDGVRIPDFSVGEDLCFMLRLYAKSRRIVTTDEIFIHYKVRNNSVISNTSEKTIFRFAEELTAMWKCADEHFRATVELVTFIHIGISMMSRAYDNPEISLPEVVGKISELFAKEFDFFRNSQFLRFGSLARHGIKGLGIWTALMFYRLHCFPLYMSMYKKLTRLLRIDIKF